MDDQVEKDIKASTGESKEKTIHIWGGVTDPNHHNPNRYRYLIHAFSIHSNLSQKMVAVKSELSDAYKIDKQGGDQSINLFEEPHRLEERVSLSMSLIDQDHTGTWAQSGIIVESPEENIVITSPTDTGSHSSSKDFLRKQGSNTTVFSGDDLLRNSKNGFYNEVVAFARSDRGEVLRLKGFFIKVSKAGKPLEPVTAKQMRQHAARYNLPLIEIPVQGPYDQERLELKENGDAWAHYNGNRYNLGSDNPDFAFEAFDEKVDSFLPSPQEIQEIVQHFVKKGDISHEQGQQIVERYRITDIQRGLPQVEVDQNGNINRVTIEEGYGKGVVQYWLGSSGYCWKVDMEGFKRALKESSLNPERSRGYDDNRYQQPISGNQVLALLESKRDYMSKEEYEKLFNFFSGIGTQIDEVYNREVSFRNKR